MRVFILGTGRCGTTTFIRACHHLEGFTAAHESRHTEVGDARFDFPDDHIEADNRLSWFLGELGDRFPDAFYVHLTRDPELVAESFLGRWPERDRPIKDDWRARLRFLVRGAPPGPRGGFLTLAEGFGRSIVPAAPYQNDGARREACRFLVRTVTANVEAFLRDKQSMTVDIVEAADWFPLFADRIGATGDLDGALAEFNTRYNATV